MRVLGFLIILDYKWIIYIIYIIQVKFNIIYWNLKTIFSMKYNTFKKYSKYTIHLLIKNFWKYIPVPIKKYYKYYVWKFVFKILLLKTIYKIP